MNTMATSRQLVNYLCIISSNNDCYSKDTHSEKAPLNKTPGLKYEHGHLVVTSNQLFIINSYTKTKFSKNLKSYWQNFFLCDRYLSYYPFYLS